MVGMLGGVAGQVSWNSCVSRPIISDVSIIRCPFAGWEPGRAEITRSEWCQVDSRETGVVPITLTSALWQTGCSSAHTRTSQGATPSQLCVHFVDLLHFKAGHLFMGLSWASHLRR